MRRATWISILAALSICVLSGAATVKADAVAAGDLVGDWVRTGPADMSGMTFDNQGKVTIYFGGADTAESDQYSIQPDGRLQITRGGAENIFFLPTLSGDQLTLGKPDGGAAIAFRRLKSGETMASAIAGAAADDQKQIVTNNAALPAFLARGDLVMEIAPPVPAGAPANCAIQLSQDAGANTFHGAALFDSKPPHVVQVMVEIRPSDENGNSAVDFHFQQSISQPAGGGGTGEEVWTFHASGTGDAMTLTSQVNFGAAFNTGANSAAIIKSDAATHKQILDSAQGEAKQMEALKAPVVAMLKDYFVIKGTAQSQFQPGKVGFDEQFTFSRGQGTTWMGQGQSKDLRTGITELVPAMAAVGIVNGKPAIQVQTQKRVYLFADIDTNANKLGGIWVSPGSQNGYPAQFSVSQSLDAAGRNQLFTTLKSSLTKLTSDSSFNGLLNDQYTDLTQRPANPVTVSLSIDGSGAVTGKVNYVLEGCTIDLKGKEVDTPLGPQIVVQYGTGAAKAAAWNDVAQFIPSVQSETWMLSAAQDSSGAMRLNGYGKTKNMAIFPIQLILNDAAENSKITAALTSGTQFKVTTPQENAPDSILTFSATPPAPAAPSAPAPAPTPARPGAAAPITPGSITVEITSGGTHIGTATHQKAWGDPKEVSGWTELVMPYDNHGRKPNYGWVVAITPTDAGLYLNGYTFSYNVGGAARPLGRWDALEVKPGGN